MSAVTVRRDSRALRLIYDRQTELLDWAAARIGVSRWPLDTVTIGVERDDGTGRGEICAVVAFNQFLDASCSAHIATDGRRRWASRGILAAWCAYPFIQCGLRRVTAPIPAGNIPAVINALKLGFRFEGMLRHAQADGDLVLLGMLREECPWLPRMAPSGLAAAGPTTAGPTIAGTATSIPEASHGR